MSFAGLDEDGNILVEGYVDKARPATLMPNFEKRLAWLVLIIWSTSGTWVGIILLQLCLRYTTSLNSANLVPKAAYDAYDIVFFTALLLLVCRVILPSLFHRQPVLHFILGTAIFITLAYPLPAMLWAYHELSYLLRYPAGLGRLAEQTTKLYSRLGLSIVIGDISLHLVLIMGLVLSLLGLAATRLTFSNENVIRRFSWQLREELSRPRRGSVAFASEHTLTKVDPDKRTLTQVRRPSILKKKTSPPEIRTRYLPNIVETLTPKSGVLDGIFATIWRKTNGRFGPKSPAPAGMPSPKFSEDTSAGAVSPATTSGTQHSRVPSQVGSSDTFVSTEQLAQLRRALDEFELQFDLLMTVGSHSRDYRKQKQDYLATAVENLVLRLGADAVVRPANTDNSSWDEKQRLARDARAFHSRLETAVIPELAIQSVHLPYDGSQQQPPLLSPCPPLGSYPELPADDDEDPYTSSVTNSPVQVSANEIRPVSQEPRAMNNYRADTTISWRTRLRNVLTQKAKVLNEGERMKTKDLLQQARGTYTAEPMRTPGAWPSTTEVQPASPMQISATEPAVDVRHTESPLVQQVRSVLEHALGVSWDTLPEHADLTDLGIGLASKVQILDGLRVATEMHLPDSLMIMQRTRTSIEEAVERYAAEQALPTVVVGTSKSAGQSLLEFLQSLVQQHGVLMRSSGADLETAKHDHVYILQTIADEVSSTLDTYEALPDGLLEDMLATVNSNYARRLNHDLEALDLEDLKASLLSQKALETLQGAVQQFQQLKSTYENRAQACAGSSLSLKSSQDLAFDEIRRTAWETIRAMSQTHMDIKIRELAMIRLEEIDLYVYNERQKLETEMQILEELALSTRGRAGRRSQRGGNTNDGGEGEHSEVARPARQGRQQRGGRGSAQGDRNAERGPRSAQAQAQPRPRSVLEEYQRSASSRSTPIHFRANDEERDQDQQVRQDEQTDKSSINPDRQVFFESSQAEDPLTFQSWQENHRMARENEQNRQRAEQAGQDAFNQARQRGGRRGAQASAPNTNMGPALRGNAAQLEEARQSMNELSGGKNESARSSRGRGRGRGGRGGRNTDRDEDQVEAQDHDGRGGRRGGRRHAEDADPTSQDSGRAQGRGRGRGVVARSRGTITRGARGRGRGRG